MMTRVILAVSSSLSNQQARDILENMDLKSCQGVSEVLDCCGDS